MIVLVMGVSGSGKSTIGRLLASALDARFVEGDDFHAAASIAKMRRGVALDDDDRAAWLAALAAELGTAVRAGEAAVLACSALKQSHRRVLQAQCPQLQVVCLRGDADLIATRMATRPGHFMPPSLLRSQLDTLELPSDALIVDVREPPSAIVRSALEWLGRQHAPARSD